MPWPSGNQLPNSPEFTFRLGAQYTFNLPAIAGDLTQRWACYWQDESDAASGAPSAVKSMPGTSAT